MVGAFVAVMQAGGRAREALLAMCLEVGALRLFAVHCCPFSLLLLLRLRACCRLAAAVGALTIPCEMHSYLPSCCIP